jgi:hypothetical protein
MALAQINLRIEQALLAQMKAEARERGLSLNSLAASAFERFLAGQASAEPSSNKMEGLEEVMRRLEQLEQKVAKQSQQAHHLPHGLAPAAPAERKPAPSKPAAAPPPEPKQMAQLGDGLLTPAELELLTGTKRGTWNAWAKPERIGQTRSDGGRQFELVGKADAPNGGNARWLWRQL